MTPKWPVRVDPARLWRLRGRAADGLIVTLGRYVTEAEAQTDCGRFTAEGNYRDLAVEAIKPPTPAPSA